MSLKRKDDWDIALEETHKPVKRFMPDSNYDYSITYSFQLGDEIDPLAIIDNPKRPI